MQSLEIQTVLQILHSGSLYMYFMTRCGGFDFWPTASQKLTHNTKLVTHCGVLNKSPPLICVLIFMPRFSAKLSPPLKYPHLSNNKL